MFQNYQCSLNIEKLTFSRSLSGLNSMTEGNAQIDVGMYGTALHPLIDYSINFQCRVSNYGHLWILLPVESNAGYFIDWFHNSSQIKYSFDSMLISLSNLAAMVKTQKNI